MEPRTSLASPPARPAVVATFRDPPVLKRDRGIVAGQSLLKVLEAENAELRNSVVALALEVQELRKSR
jgi:hypothetical protein